MNFTAENKERLSQLFVKCIENNLVIDYVPASKGLMILSEEYMLIAAIWMDSDDQASEFNWVHHQIDEFIKGEKSNEANKVTQFKVS